MTAERDRQWWATELGLPLPPLESEWWAVYKPAAQAARPSDLLDLLHFRPAVDEAEARRRLDWSPGLIFIALDDPPPPGVG